MTFTSFYRTGTCYMAQWQFYQSSLFFFVNLVIIDVLFKNSKRKLICMNFRFAGKNKQVMVAKKNLKIWSSLHVFLRFPYAFLGLAVKFFVEFVITLASVINKFKNLLLLQLLPLRQIHQYLGCVSSAKVCTTNAISQMTLPKKLLHVTPFFGREEGEEKERLSFSRRPFRCLDLLLQ